MKVLATRTTYRTRIETVTVEWSCGCSSRRVNSRLVYHRTCDDCKKFHAA